MSSQIGGVRLDLAPVSASGQQATYFITVFNETGLPTRLSLQARDQANGLICRFSPGEFLAVPPGEQRTVNLHVKPAVAETVGQAHRYNLAVEAVPEGVAATNGADQPLLGSATFTYVPRVGTRLVPRRLRRLPLWALLLLPLALLALAFMAGTRTVGANTGNPPPPSTATVVPTNTATPAPTAGVALPHLGAFGVRAGANGLVTISWSSTHAATLRLDGKPVPSVGQETIPLSKPRTLVLVAANAGGSASQTLVLTPAQMNGVPSGLAPYLPAILTFTIERGRTGTPLLRWRVDHADTVTVNGQRVAAGDERPLGQAGPATYALVGTNQAGTVTSTLIVPRAGAALHFSVAPHPPRITGFALARGKGNGGFMLVWTTSGAGRVLLNGKQAPPSGSLALGSPQPGSVFDLVASNAQGSSHAQVRVQLLGGGVPAQHTISLDLPHIVRFVVEVVNGARQVTWQVTGARQVSLDGATVAATGAQAVPAGQSTLTLLATNDVGTQRRQIPVVGPTPVPPSATPPPPSATATRAATATLAPPTATATTHPPSRTPTPRPGAPSATHAPIPTQTLVPTHTPIPTTAPAATATQGIAPPTATPVKPSTPTHTPRPTAKPTSPRIAIPPTWTPTPVNTRRPTPRPTATATPRPPSATVTARPPTSTNTPRLPTATPVPPSATLIPPSATPVPPTSTATPLTPTATPVPPSATPIPPSATPVPPTPTNTPVPPTNTPSFTPTNTPVPTDTDTPSVTPTDTPLPFMEISPTSAATPVQIDDQQVVTFTLSDKGPGDLNGINPTVSPPGAVGAANGFAVSGNTCSGGVSAGSSCTIDVTAYDRCNSPDVSGTLTVDANAIDTPLTVQLNGFNGC